MHPINIDNFNSFDLNNKSIVIVKRDYNLGVKVIVKSSLKDLALKKTAIFLEDCFFSRSRSYSSLFLSSK